ncbi:DUF3618 domain-containing protein [Billgrantia saliphila]|uniref:DUF3618 domain-containing protein n=1 Tax=Billgrantia saliphila TaxID=1848458 RepID=UPI000CE2E77B|nr:DUF3618 domain-containing protein [Halomonas saliphila]
MRSYDRNPDEIEADIQRSRAHLNDTLHEIESRLSPQQLKRQAAGFLPRDTARSFFDNLGNSVRENPVPVLLTGVGLGWLVYSQFKPRSDSQRTQADSSYGGTGSGMIPARSEAPQRMTATHLGSQQGRSVMSSHRPDVVGVATHLGTGQGWSGYVHPSV